MGCLKQYPLESGQQRGVDPHEGLEIVRNIYGEIAKIADYRERIGLRGIFPELNATVDDLDHNPWPLNMENGTIDSK